MLFFSFLVPESMTVRHSKLKKTQRMHRIVAATENVMGDGARANQRAKLETNEAEPLMTVVNRRSFPKPEALSTWRWWTRRWDAGGAKRINQKRKKWL